ncbi:TlpA family protein disulfide reductase [Neptunicella marina]|uniref:TlpA family protein disulfide reductase n=1 Tax=Neptunicella marina TaxID=2125989 RepID=A0A8J6IUH9_9ALTE|nr:TlpA disulfide reductase family protein [Neptunicella marina]MBC3765703.1 TlpA family protein disulfide reductase [Neptunicella marina]
MKKYVLLLLMFCSWQLVAKNMDLEQIKLQIAGKQVSLKQLSKGKPLYLKFWATWCKPCMQQMPHYSHAYQKFGKDIQFVSINIDINETPEAVAAVINKHHLTMPQTRDTNKYLANLFHMNGTPYHVLLNANATIVHTGNDADEELDRKLALLAAHKAGDLPAISLTDSAGKEATLSFDDGQTHILFFTATWCDWYLADTRPQMAKACAKATNVLEQWHQQHNQAPLQAIVNHLWTGAEDVKQFSDKFSLHYPVALDHSGDLFFSFSISQLPTLIVIKNGEEVLRTNKVESLQQLTDLLADY